MNKFCSYLCSCQRQLHVLTTRGKMAQHLAKTPGSGEIPVILEPEDPTPKEPKVCDDRPIILLPLILSYSRNNCTLHIVLINDINFTRIKWCYHKWWIQEIL
eukprot:XP_011427224.1 PREDICTED: uncharacterized protein LOC105328154 [Crassostrea gigas]